MVAIPLPPNPFPALKLKNEPQSLWHEAYNQCLSFEKRFQVVGTDSNNRRVVEARTLGYLLLNALSDSARTALSRDILQLSVPPLAKSKGQPLASAFDKLGELAQSWINLIWCFKYPNESGYFGSESNTPLFDGSQRMIDGLLQKPPDRGSAKQKALVRDQYKCVLTGKTDGTGRNPILAQRKPNIIVPLSVTDAAYIIPASLNEDLASEDPHKEKRTTSFWTMLNTFTGFDIKEELNEVEGGIHSLKNVITMDLSEKSLFDDLIIWFEATERPNEYKLCAVHPLYIIDYPPTITFTTTDPINFPVPSPRYITLHAAFARVSHSSGVGDYIDRLKEERENTHALEPGGGSAILLERLLSSTLLGSNSEVV